MNDKVKVLIIDDNPIDRKLTRAILEKNGFLVVDLSRASSCLEIISAENPSLVLLDILMPDMNGNQALQLIRSKYSAIELPVIMVTSKSDATDIVESLELGANDYITKPIQINVALRRIETHLTISTQAKLIAKTRELEALHATIITFKHELNNPLAIALGMINGLKKEYSNEDRFLKLETAIWRTANVIKILSELLTKTSFQYDQSTQYPKLISFKREIN